MRPYFYPPMRISGRNFLSAYAVWFAGREGPTEAYVTHLHADFDPGIEISSWKVIWKAETHAVPARVFFF